MLLTLERIFESFRRPIVLIGYFFVAFADGPCVCKFVYAFRLVSCSWILHILPVTPCLLFHRLLSPTNDMSMLAGGTLCDCNLSAITPSYPWSQVQNTSVEIRFRNATSKSNETPEFIIRRLPRP